MAISPNILKMNQALYNKKRPDYPYEVITGHYKESKLSPLVFDKQNPNVDFATIPLSDGMHWLFQTFKELEKFELWRNKKL